MKIVQVMAGNEEGGLEQHFEALCNGLSDQYEVHVIAHEKYKDRFNRNISFHALDLSKGRNNPLILFRLLRTIRVLNPDILHAHANKAVDMVAKIMNWFPSHVKTVATLHSTKRKLKSFEKFDHVIGVSHEVLKRLKNVQKSVIYNGMRLPSGISKDKAYLKQFGIEENDFVLCAAGRLEEVKNFPLLLRAIEGMDVKLLLMGEGSKKEELEILVRKLGLEQKVIFTGFRTDVLQIIASSDLYVLSSDKEGFPYVIVEALLLETPVIATDVSDLKKILPHSCVVPVGDVMKLREKIHDVQTHFKEYLVTYDEAFVFAREHFTIESMLRGVIKVYDEVSKR